MAWYNDLLTTNTTSVPVNTTTLGQSISAITNVLNGQVNIGELGGQLGASFGQQFAGAAANIVGSQATAGALGQVKTFATGIMNTITNKFKIVPAAIVAGIIIVYFLFTHSKKTKRGKK